MNIFRPYKQVYVYCMGFFGDESRTDGIEQAWWRQKCRHRGNPDVWVLDPLHWNDNARAVGGMVAKRTLRESHIGFGGHSWAIGQFYSVFWRALRARNRVIGRACFADGVQRNRFIPKILPINPTALSRWGTIWAGNTDHITAFYQRRTRPWGHKIRWEKGEELNQKGYRRQVEWIHLQDENHSSIDMNDRVQTEMLSI